MSFKETILDEYVKVQGGYAYKSGDFIENSSYPVLRIKNVGFGEILYSDTAFISEYLAKSTLEWKVKKGDLLISMTGSNFNAPNSLVGRVARVWENKDAWINQRVGRIKPKEDNLISLDFVYYLLSQKAIQHFLVANSTGSGNQANISAKTIGLVPCPKIDFITSEKISSFLIKFDEKIIKNNQINETLEAMAQAIFKSWFVDFDPVKAKVSAREAGLDSDAINRAAMRVIASKTDSELDDMQAESSAEYANLQTTASHFPDELVESELGMIPKGWEVKEVGKLLTRLPTGKRYSKKDVQYDGSVPVYEQGVNILLGFHNKEADLMATLDEPYFIFGDHTCITYLISHPFSVSQNVIPLKGENVSTYWVFYAIQGKQTFQEYKRHWSDLQIQIVVKPKQDLLINFFGKTIRRIQLLKESNLEQNFTLTKLRDSLLPKLLSGEIEV
ncbi:MAG TPA: restriction endonuclease subunit S [Candidatus Ignatzschineria merdigallinarum]|uniref:Restriction endonuclease subunit S n=1 Tax=Candidatus Ignatzschineria merdigallinarum TaxID=2838621 RepID=A0A9D1Q5V4_9GAMM|nr:restriction endonuclease subunit S [Candidatus Ignatzschineria merdigallinarum]